MKILNCGYTYFKVNWPSDFSALHPRWVFTKDGPNISDITWKMYFNMPWYLTINYSITHKTDKCELSIIGIDKYGVATIISISATLRKYFKTPCVVFKVNKKKEKLLSTWKFTEKCKKAQERVEVCPKVKLNLWWAMCVCRKAV